MIVKLHKVKDHDFSLQISLNCYQLYWCSLKINACMIEVHLNGTQIFIIPAQTICLLQASSALASYMK